MEAHTNVDIVVDLRELEALLDATLPAVFRGATIAEAALPWPSEAEGVVLKPHAASQNSGSFNGSLNDSHAGG